MTKSQNSTSLPEDRPYNTITNNTSRPADQPPLFEEQNDGAPFYDTCDSDRGDSDGRGVETDSYGNL